MGLFGSLFGDNSLKNEKPSITKDDEKWVDNSFGWLLLSWGYPKKEIETFIFNEKYFPVTFHAKKISVENLLDDLCNLLSIYRSTISYSLIPDIRDIPQTPHSIYGKAFESDIEVIKKDFEPTHYNIHIANSLVYEEELLMRRLILELIKVKVNEKLSTFISDGDVLYFVYIAAIYFGFGVIMSKALVDVKVQYVAGWQSTSKNKSDVPPAVIAYALAFYARLHGSEYIQWENQLPKSIKHEFTLAKEQLVDGSDKIFFDEVALKNDVEIRKHTAAAKQFTKNKQFEEAIKEYELAIPLVKNNTQLSVMYVNIGYACQRAQKLEKSIDYFSKALDIRPNYAYAVNNLGFSYILIGQLEKGKEYLDKVDISDDTLKAYILRDTAVYYTLKGNMEEANNYFQKTFETNTGVDLLEYFYAKYLFANSEKEEGMRYLALSGEKGEKEAIELMTALK
jgi:tetratricopeptide (TPR) repeat protein